MFEFYQTIFPNQNTSATSLAWIGDAKSSIKLKMDEIRSYKDYKVANFEDISNPVR